MTIEEKWGNLFKPEIKRGGFQLHEQGKISIAGSSDTTIDAYVRVSSPIRVRLACAGTGAESLTAGCTCPAGKKSRFCKHIWATLLETEEKHPDFLSEKRVIEKRLEPLDAPDPRESPEITERARATSERQETYKAAAKERAGMYRKLQYQKNKLRKQKAKSGRSNADHAPDLSRFPEEIQVLLAYFAQNGFAMPQGPDEAIICGARRRLARVFHPDKGGSNDEMVELNRNCERLLEYLRVG